MEKNISFDCWCIVELFGHTRIAGKCTEQNIAGANMLRVDAPETKAQPAFSRFLGNAAIYAINPVDEKTARVIAESINQKPVQHWELTEFLEKADTQKRLASPAAGSIAYDNMKESEEDYGAF